MTNWNRMKNVLAVVLACGMGFFFTGCAEIMTKPFPDTGGRVLLSVVKQTPSNRYGWPYDDWPQGAYLIPDSNVLVSEVQGNENVAESSALFGVIGMLVSTGDLAGDARKKVQGMEPILSPDLTSVIQKCLRERLATDPETARFTEGDAADPAAMRVIPYMVFNFVDEQKADLWLILKAERADPGNPGQHWYCRYIVGLDDPRPIQGPDGWTAGQGDFLKAALEKDATAGIQVMMEDLNGKLRNSKIPLQTMTRSWAFYKKPQSAEVQVLAKTKDWQIVLPHVPDDEFFAGINVLPRDLVEPVQAAPGPH